MTYVYLNFKNCGLISTKSHYKRGIKYNNNLKINGDFRIRNYALGHNLDTPIPYTLLSNVLHVLCGEIPVPTNRPTFLKRVGRLDEIAKTAKYHIDNGYKYITPNGQERYIYKENICTKNHAYNSEMNGAATNIELFDGTKIKVKAIVNWTIFNSSFPETSMARRVIIEFINKTIGRDCEEMELTDVIKNLSEYWGELNFKMEADKMIGTLKDNGVKLNKPWQLLLLGKSGDEKLTKDSKLSIHNYSANRPLLTPNGTGYKINISGLIGFEVDDNDEIIGLLKNGTGMANMLEHGVVEIKYIGKNDIYAPIKGNFKPIFSENMDDNELNDNGLA